MRNTPAEPMTSSHSDEGPLFNARETKKSQSHQCVFTQEALTIINTINEDKDVGS